MKKLMLFALCATIGSAWGAATIDTDAVSIRDGKLYYNSNAVNSALSGTDRYVLVTQLAQLQQLSDSWANEIKGRSFLEKRSRKMYPTKKDRDEVKAAIEKIQKRIRELIMSGKIH